MNHMRIALLSLLAAATGAWATPIQDGQNLIEDPSFESAPLGDKLPTGWGQWSAEGSKYKVSVVEGGRGSKRSLLVSGQGQETAINSKRVPVAKGERYILSGYTRVEGDKSARATLQLVYWSKEDQWLGNTTYGEARSDPSGWQLLATVSTVEKHPKAAWLSFALTVNGAGKVWFDDLALAKIRPAVEGNLIANGDLEAWTDGTPVCWSKGHPKEGKIVLTRGDEKSIEGAACLRMAGQSPWASAYSGGVEVDRSKRYRATAFVRVRKGAAQLQIGYFDKEKWLGSSDTATVSPGPWTGLILDADLSKFNNIARIGVSVVATGGEFDVLVDDVTLMEQGGR